MEEGQTSPQLKRGFNEETQKVLQGFFDDPEADFVGVETTAREVLEDIAHTGLICYEWSHIRKVFNAVVKKTLNEFPDDDSVEDVDAALARISGTMESMGRPPYTIQRLCEVILRPREMYYNLKKYLFAVEKLATVNYTITVLSSNDYIEQVKSLYENLQNLREPKELEER